MPMAMAEEEAQEAQAAPTTATGAGGAGGADDSDSDIAGSDWSRGSNSQMPYDDFEESAWRAVGWTPRAVPTGDQADEWRWLGWSSPLYMGWTAQGPRVWKRDLAEQRHLQQLCHGLAARQATSKALHRAAKWCTFQWPSRP